MLSYHIQFLTLCNKYFGGTFTLIFFEETPPALYGTLPSNANASPYHKYQSIELFFKHFPLKNTSFMIILIDYIMCKINIRKEIKAIEDNTILAGKIVRKTLETTILF